jgi:1,4-alpha-glucan branching enzyme
LKYGGSGVLNHDVAAQQHGSHGREYSLVVALPPLSTIILGRD